MDDTVVATGPSSGEPSDDKGLGQLVANRYRIVRWLGGGGMGRVYEAFDTELAERVALKVLRGGLTQEALERFRREVRLTRRIQHKHVARMFDIGEHAGDRFLTMELVDGEPLSRAFSRRLAWPELRGVALQICEGLAAAHATGIVHRDLKPDNVLIEDGTQRAVITDFGIARGGDEVHMTQVGAIVGTPRYMSPEQLAGREVDARADIFSLGVMLFELATGTLPWAGDSAVAIAIAQATQPARPFASRTLPAALGDVLLRCLALEPADRIASARALADELAQIAVDAPPATTGRAQRSTLAPPLPRSTPWPATGTHAAAETTIAVLPFERCAPEDRYLADGLREEIIDTLSMTTGLRVRPASTSVASDPREAGRALEVEHVVSGALQRMPDGLRVVTRLVSVADGFQIWAFKTTCSEAEVLAVSDHVARGVADALSARAAPPAKPVDPRAVELYLRAREELRRFWGDHARRAAEYLDEAVQIAPDAALILGARAYAHVHAWVRSNRPEALVTARATVQRALATGIGEAVLASGVLHLNLGDHAAAAREYRVALARAPMSAAVHEHIGRLLVEVDPGPTGRTHLQTALELDPARDIIITGDLARLAAFDRDWDEVERRVAPILHHADPSISMTGVLYASRFRSWQGDMKLAVEQLTVVRPGMPPLFRELFDMLAAAHHDHAVDAARWRQLTNRLVVEVQASRTRLIMAQRMLEFAALHDFADVARDAMQLCDRLGLVDIVWVDRCCALDSMRARADWLALRQPIADRAARVLAAYQSPTTA